MQPGRMGVYHREGIGHDHYSTCILFFPLQASVVAFSPAAMIIADVWDIYDTLTGKARPVKESGTGSKQSQSNPPFIHRGAQPLIEI